MSGWEGTSPRSSTMGEAGQEARLNAWQERDGMVCGNHGGVSFDGVGYDCGQGRDAGSAERHRSPGCGE